MVGSDDSFPFWDSCLFSPKFAPLTSKSGQSIRSMCDVMEGGKRWPNGEGEVTIQKVNGIYESGQIIATSDDLTLKGS